jgi:hypothetical protein
MAQPDPHSALDEPPYHFMQGKQSEIKNSSRVGKNLRVKEGKGMRMANCSSQRHITYSQIQSDTY